MYVCIHIYIYIYTYVHTYVMAMSLTTGDSNHNVRGYCLDIDIPRLEASLNNFTKTHSRNKASD